MGITQIKNNRQMYSYNYSNLAKTVLYLNKSTGKSFKNIVVWKYIICMHRISYPPDIPSHHTLRLKIVQNKTVRDRDVGQAVLCSSWLGIDENGFNFRFTLTTSGWKLIVSENLRLVGWYFFRKKINTSGSLEYLKAINLILITLLTLHFTARDRKVG